MHSPSSSFERASPQQHPPPMPSTNGKICLRLPTNFLFTSISLRFPHSKSSLSSLHASFLPMAETSKSVSAYLILAENIINLHISRCTATNFLHVRCTDVSLVKVSHPTEACASQINLKNWPYSSSASFQPPKLFRFPDSHNSAFASTTKHQSWKVFG